MASGGGYPGPRQGNATSEATHGKSLDSKTAVWYKIPITQASEKTRTKLHPEICRVLEEAYQQGRKDVCFVDTDNGFSFTAFVQSRYLYLTSNRQAHARLERVCEERQSDITINTAVDQGQSPQTSNEKKTNDTRATHGKSLDSKTAVWYKIPITQASEKTRTRLHPEICRVLEEAYQQGRKDVCFVDTDNGFSFTAFFQSKFLYLTSNQRAHARLERVCEDREEDKQRNTAVGRGISPQTSNENRNPIDTEQRQMVEQYKEKASHLVAWMKDVINGIMQKTFPADLKDIKSELAEIVRIRTEDIPKWLEIMKEMLRIYEELQNYGAKPVIDDSLVPQTVEQLCVMFDSESKNRETRLLAEAARFEKLQVLLEKTRQETGQLDATLHDIERQITEMKKCSLQEKQHFDALNGELKSIDGRIIKLGRDVEVLHQGEYTNMDVVNKFIKLQTRAAEVKTFLFSVSSQIPHPEVSIKNVMITAPYQKSSNKHMVETNFAFQHVQDCLQRLKSMQATLEGEWYGRDMNSVKQALSEHSQKYQDILNFTTEVDLCIKDREKLPGKEQENYNEWLSKVHEAYAALKGSSLQRLQRLQSLLDFVQAAEQELDWLKDKIEQICNCGQDLLNMPLTEIFQDVSREMKLREANFVSIQQNGYSLVSQTHPVKVTIEDYILSMTSHWSWLQLFLQCLGIQIINRSNFTKFFKEAGQFEEWIHQRIGTLNSWMELLNSSFDELQKIKKDCQGLQNEFVQYEEYVTSLHKRSDSIIPFKQQFQHDSFLNKVCCVCIYEQPTISLHSGEECILLDNSQKIKWKVRNAKGQEDMVPSICLQILPPNTDAVDLADRLKGQLAELKTLIRTLTKTIIVSQMQFIKTLDRIQLQSQDLADCEDLLRDLNNDATKLIEDFGDADQMMVEELQKELDECKQKLSDLSKQLKEQGSKNDPAVQRTQYSTEEAVSSILEPNTSRRENETDSELLETDKELVVNETVRASLEHVKERENEIEKSVARTLTIPAVQMLIDSNFQGELTRHIPAVAVVHRSNEVIFHGPPEAIREAEEHLEEYLKSKGYLHEFAPVASVTALCKRLNFEYYIKIKFPDVHIIFADRKIIFIGEGKLIKEVEDELCRFQSTTKRNVLPYCSSVQNYLKLQDIQKYIWKHFEERHIECFWQVTNEGIELFCRNEDQRSSAKIALEECIACKKLSFKSDSDFQRFQDNHDVKKFIHQNEGRLYKEVLEVGCLMYVGMPEVLVELEKLYDRHMIDQENQPQGHSSQVLLSHSLLAFVKKYLMENIREEFKVILELDDLSGIKIIGSKDTVHNAVLKVQKHVQKMFVDVCLLHSPKVANPITGIVKDIVTTVEEENKTIVDLISLPRTGKNIMTVTVNNTLDICLVYGSSPSKDANVELIPLNDCFIPVCLAALDIMKKGVDLQKKAADALQKYIRPKGKKPEAFTFIADNDGDGKHLLYFVVPDFPNNIVNFENDFKKGLMSVFDYASERAMTLSLPVEMHEKLPVRTMSTIIMEAVNAYLAEVAQQTSIKKIFLCSVEKSSHMILKQVLDAVTQTNSSGGKIEEDYCDIGDEGDEHVNISVVVGSLLEQKVDVIVNSASKELSLTEGSLSKTILEFAGSTIQEECKVTYPNGINFGEVAVTKGGKLMFKKIFHGALCRGNQKTSRVILRSVVKNCLHKAYEGKFHSIAFPALGVGGLNYPVKVVAKEMFWTVKTYADRYEVTDVKFVLANDNKEVFETFKEMENTMTQVQSAAEDCWSPYEISLEGYKVLINIAVSKTSTMCDVEVLLWNPPAKANTESHTIKCSDDYETWEKTLTLDRDPKNWSERLYLCLDELAHLKEEIGHVLSYVKRMKFTSFAVYISEIKNDTDVYKHAVEDVIQSLVTFKSYIGDLERVKIIISDDMLQKLTPWFGEKVASSHGRDSFKNKVSSFLGFKDLTHWKKLPTQCKEAKRTYIRITGSDSTSVGTTHETLKKRLDQLIATEEKISVTKSHSHDSNDVLQDGADSERPREESADTNGRVLAKSAQAPNASVVHGLPSHTDLTNENDRALEIYLYFKTEVAVEVLNIIRDSQGGEGLNALTSDLKQIVKTVKMSGAKVVIHCDFKHAKKVQECVFNHYKRARENKGTQDKMRHLIEGGSDMRDLLQFAYKQEHWSKKLEVVEGKLYFLGMLHFKEMVETAVKTLKQWCQDEFFLSDDEQKRTEEAIHLVRNEFPAIFVKATSDKIVLKGEDADIFEKAKHKMKVALGRVKLTSRERRGRNLQTVAESFLSLPQEDRMDTSLMSLPSNSQTSQHRVLVTSKPYHTREGIMVKVYLGDIVRLPVDCIVNAANQNLSHGGGVALAIAKAAGREFDQESEEYVRRHGIIPVTQCCVTSAGRLPYKKVIHVVGPQWHDYKQNEKDKCAHDLKETVVNCLNKANELNMTSIAVTSISSGIFGVPKQICAKMYAKGVIEYSKTCGLQSLKEIHFVDVMSEMCQLTQLAFETELDSSPEIQNHPQDSQNLLVVHASTNLPAGTKQSPYIFRPLEHLSILIYSHDITDVDVNAIVCPVNPDIEGGIVQSVKKSCGLVYAETDYERVMAEIKTKEVIITSVTSGKLLFQQIIHVYSPDWIGLKQQKDGKRLKEHVKKFIQCIFEKTVNLGLASVAIPVLGIGDDSMLVNSFCECMMDEVLDFCSKSDILPSAHTAIHLVTDKSPLACKLNEYFEQNCELTEKRLQSGERSVAYSKNDLRVTVKNDNQRALATKGSLTTSIYSSMNIHVGQNETCPICLDTPVDPVAFKMCGHILCRNCMECTMKSKPVCPLCGKVYGKITGNQPPGNMDIKATPFNLPGFKNCGTIEIFYSFPDGIQTEEHPYPGRPYKGTKRRAYLPDNAEGRKVLSLLKKAFDRCLVFTVGRSVTTGAENIVTWNDIHHKTNRDGGSQNYGYPDPDYLRRVQEELAAKGVTEDT